MIGSLFCCRRNRPRRVDELSVPLRSINSEPEQKQPEVMDSKREEKQKESCSVTEISNVVPMLVGQLQRSRDRHRKNNLLMSFIKSLPSEILLGIFCFSVWHLDRSVKDYNAALAAFKSVFAENGQWCPFYMPEPSSYDFRHHFGLSFFSMDATPTQFSHLTRHYAGTRCAAYLENLIENATFLGYSPLMIILGIMIPFILAAILYYLKIIPGYYLGQVGTQERLNRELNQKIHQAINEFKSITLIQQATKKTTLKTPALDETSDYYLNSRIHTQLDSFFNDADDENDGRCTQYLCCPYVVGFSELRKRSENRFDTIMKEAALYFGALKDAVDKHINHEIPFNFLLGHHETNKDSAIHRFFKSSMYDKHLLKIIFEMAQEEPKTQLQIGLRP